MKRASTADCKRQRKRNKRCKHNVYLKIRFDDWSINFPKRKVLFRNVLLRPCRAIGYCAGIIRIFSRKRWSVIRTSDRGHEIRYVRVDNYTVGPDKRFDRLLRNRIRSLPNPSTSNEFRQSRLETAQTLLILAAIQSCLMVFQIFLFATSR